MSEPLPPTEPGRAPRPLEPLPEIGEPFAPAPRPVRGREGCGRAALLGCGVIVLLLGVAAVLFVAKAPVLLGWIFGKFEEQVERSLPADLSPEETQRLEAAFASLDAAIRQGEIDTPALQRLQQKILGISQRIESGLTVEDVRELTVLLEDAAGGAAADPAVDTDLAPPAEGSTPAASPDAAAADGPPEP